MIEPKAMREIHEIREKLGKKKESMTIAERVEKDNAELYRLQKKYGFTIVDVSPDFVSGTTSL